MRLTILALLTLAALAVLPAEASAICAGQWTPAGYVLGCVQLTETCAWYTAHSGEVLWACIRPLPD